MKYYLNLSGNKICGFHVLPVPNHVEYEADESFQEYLELHIGKISLINGEIVEDAYDFEKLLDEKDEILNWLFQNDWIPNKIVTGEWTTDDVRWTTYLQERVTKRTRLDEIEVELASL